MDPTELLAVLRPLWSVWFMLVFVGIVAWALWPGNRRRLEDHGRIPFRDER
jgi:cytochrome c oxidase cbb3-type subunit 4